MGSLQERTLKNGTTTACWFATIHLEASLILADVIGKLLLVGWLHR